MAGLPNVCWATMGSHPQGPERYGEPQPGPCSTVFCGEPWPFTFALSWPPFCKGSSVRLELSFRAIENGALSFEVSQPFLSSYPVVGKTFLNGLLAAFRPFGAHLPLGVSI